MHLAGVQTLLQVTLLTLAEKKKERLFSGLFYRKEVDSMVTPIHRSPVYVIKGFKLLLFIFQACFFLFIYLFFGLFVNLVITAICCLVPEWHVAILKWAMLLLRRATMKSFWRILTFRCVAYFSCQMNDLVENGPLPDTTILEGYIVSYGDTASWTNLKIVNHDSQCFCHPLDEVWTKPKCGRCLIF